MSVYLIVLIVIAALALDLFLLYKYLEWDRYSRGRPYKLDSFEPEEYALLVQAYAKAIEPETGTNHKQTVIASDGTDDLTELAEKAVARLTEHSF